MNPKPEPSTSQPSPRNGQTPSATDTLSTEIPTPAPLVSVSDLHTHFHTRAPVFSKEARIHRAVDGVSFEVGAAETLGLVGESGCGKTTVGRTILRLIPATSGRVTFDGADVFTARGGALKRLRRDMQIVFQDPAGSLNPRMRIADIVSEPLEIHGVASSKKERRDSAARLLERCGMPLSAMDRYPHEFSGGQRQRIGIARALILEPDFVVCDEPISALDVSVQAQVVNLLDALKASMGLTMLFIAHDLSMVRYVSDRMAVMYLGTLVEIGPANDVFFDPKHPYTEILIGSNPEPDPEAERHRDSTQIRGEIPSPVNVKPGCRFAGRCPKVMDVCRTTTPELIPLKDDGNRQVACHLLS